MYYYSRKLLGEYVEICTYVIFKRYTYLIFICHANFILRVWNRGQTFYKKLLTRQFHLQYTYEGKKRHTYLPRYFENLSNFFSTVTGWAHAATSALSDRIKIMRNASWPDFNISPQVLISCGPDDGCHGGDSGNANAFMASGDGITDETCSIYR